MQDLINTFFGAIIATLSGVVFVKSILKEKIRTKKLYIILITITNSIITQSLYYLDFMSSKVVIGFFLYFLLFKITFKMSNSKTFLTSIVFYLLIFVAEISFFAFSTNLLKISGSNTYTQYGGTLLGSICVSIIVLFLGYLLRNFLRTLINIKVPKSFLIYCGSACFCIVILLLAVAVDTKLNTKTFILLGMATTVIATVFFSLKQTYQNHELTLKYDKLLEFIKKYEIEIDNQRILRHETKNQFIVIKSKIIDCDKESNIIEYIDEIIKETNHKIVNSEYAKLRYLPSNGLKGLFYFKVSEALEQNISVDINIAKTIENSFLSSLNSQTFNQVGKILGIFLDNAIEGAQECSNKSISLEAYCLDNEITFVISNSYITNKRLGLLKSTKGPNRGHGLLLAQQIINLNNKLSNETIITENIYIQKLKIKN